jgi:hypothetical protein
MRSVRTVLPRGRDRAPVSNDPLVRLEHLADLRTRGVLDQAEYEREKAALLSPAP